jgi:hypothetical protein
MNVDGSHPEDESFQHGSESFAFPVNVQQVFFPEDCDHPQWKVVYRVDVRSRRTPLHFAVDKSEVLGIGRDADFDGFTRDYRNNVGVPGVVPDPETVYLPDSDMWTRPVQRLHLVEES